MPEYTPEQLILLWEQFLNSPHGEKYAIAGSSINGHYYSGLESIKDMYPDTRSLCVDWYDLDHFDIELASYLLEYPDLALYAGEAALKNFLPPDLHERHENVRVRLRILNLPEKTPMPTIGVKHMGNLITVEGILRKITEIYPTLKVGAYECARCGGVGGYLLVDQELKLGSVLERQPLECYREQGGCGRAASSTAFKLIEDASTFINTEKFEVQDLPEGAFGAKIERKIGYLFDDLTGKLQPGDRVKITAVVRLRQQYRRSSTPTTEFKFLLDVNSLEILERTYEDISLTDEDIIRIKKEANDPMIIDNLTASIAPNVWGQNYPKLAIVLQIISGKEILNPDGTKLRGDIHIILVGDPSTAKTQILIAVSKLAPRGMYVQGKQTTAAGLTAAAVKDQFAGERWSLEAGAMVLADRGILCISDFHNMNPDDRTAMHDALEQQVVSIAKAGITAKLNARCSVLADANPKFGRWDDFTPVSEQLNLSPAIVSRFDSVFVIKDKPHKDRDKAISQHILSGYSDMTESGGVEYEPYFDGEFFRKYVAYAKTIVPKLEENGTPFTMLKDYYLQTRSNPQAAEEGAVSITARQLGGLVRYAFASARARLCETVEVQDAERSIEIMSHYLNNFVNEGGILDIDMIASGTSHSQRSMIMKLTDIITQLQQESERNLATEDNILECMASDKPERVRKALEKMVKEGNLSRPTAKKNEYRIV